MGPNTGQGKYLITFSFFYYRQGITKQFIQIQERNSMQFAAWFHYWSVSKRNLFIPYLMQFIKTKTQERRFSPIYCNNQLTAFLLISNTPYLTRHSNTTVADSLPERCLTDHYSISQASSVCIWLLQTQHFDPETLLSNSHSLGGRDKFILPNCRMSLSL